MTADAFDGCADAERRWANGQGGADELTLFGPSMRDNFSHYFPRDELVDIGSERLGDQRLNMLAHSGVKQSQGGWDKRRILVITAPFGPFSRELAVAIRASGGEVFRVLLNAGDVLDWGLANGRIFAGRRETWASWLGQIIRRDRITDIVTYGDSSFYAAAALSLARDAKLRTFVLEQGYFRPDWVTLEREGVNAQSGLPRDPDWYRNHPCAKVLTKAQPVGRATPSSVRNIVFYHLFVYLGALSFPHFRLSYKDSTFRQALGHIARFVLQKLRHGEERRIHERALSATGPKFLLLLQRPGDSQLWRHSHFKNNIALIETVCESFSAFAPKNAQLLIRPHPLDPGLIPYRRHLAAVARKCCLAQQVSFSDYGKLHELLPKVSGLICVNSTGGLAGVEFGISTITLGNAHYNIPGLTHQGPLDTYWQSPQKPDPDLYLAYRNVAMAETQVNGGFATAPGRRLAIPILVERLLCAAEAISEAEIGASQHLERASPRPTTTTVS